MSNPLLSILPFIEIISNEIKILPAAGGALAELLRPDQEEIEDVIINKNYNLITEFSEKANLAAQE